MEQLCKDGKEVGWQVWIKREFLWPGFSLALLD